MIPWNDKRRETYVSIFHSVKRNTWLGEESKQDLHEIFGHDQIDLMYERSDCMAADIFTKAITNKDKWKHALDLVNITDLHRMRRSSYCPLQAPCVGVCHGT